MKQTALDELGFPITVKEGFIGKLQLKVPWHNLKNEPLVVIIERVFILAVPNDGSWDDTKQQQREQAMKQDQLTRIEMMRATQTDQDQQGPLTALITKVLDNLQIFINDVHIRYEGLMIEKEFRPVKKIE